MFRLKQPRSEVVVAAPLRVMRRGVAELVNAAGLALACNSRFAIQDLPLYAAQCSGVEPLSVTALTLAPAYSSLAATASLP